MDSQGAIAFDHFFSEVYGERWPHLKSALLEKEKQIARKNKFASDFPEFQFQGEIPRAQNGLLSYYVMDPASQVPAFLLYVQAGEKVLDMCAAPGGKTLILAEGLWVGSGSDTGAGELIANEPSEARRDRLTKVIQNYIPRDVRSIIHVKGKDGGKYALTHREYFDKILIDAPCSGERHLLENQKELGLWTLSRSKKLAQRQYALLTAGLLALRPGGHLVYSTCSISPLENDGVIETLLKKKEGFSVVPVEDVMLEGAAPLLGPALESAAVKDLTKSTSGVGGIGCIGEKTKYGRIFLPDQCGAGPIYCALIRKAE